MLTLSYDRQWQHLGHLVMVFFETLGTFKNRILGFCPAFIGLAKVYSIVGGEEWKYQIWCSYLSDDHECHVEQPNFYMVMRAHTCHNHTKPIFLHFIIYNEHPLHQEHFPSQNIGFFSQLREDTLHHFEIQLFVPARADWITLSTNSFLLLVKNQSWNPGPIFS